MERSACDDFRTLACTIRGSVFVSCGCGCWLKSSAMQLNWLLWFMAAFFYVSPIKLTSKYCKLLTFSLFSLKHKGQFHK